MKQKKVKCVESPIFKLAEIIWQRGYLTGHNYDDCCHLLYKENITSYTKNLGILKITAPGNVNSPFLFRLPKVAGIGNIQIGGQSWTMEVYGRNNVSELENLASQLTEKFGVTINLSLEREHPKKGDSRDITHYVPEL